MTLEELDERDADELPSDESDDVEEAELDEDDADVEEDDEEEEEEDDALGGDEEDEDGQASLEELIAQRAAGRKAAEETDETDEIMALASEADEPVVEPLPVKVAPVEEQKEFVCKSCYLVKPRVQLADEKRGYCRDCV